MRSYITAIGTANPPTRVRQQQVAQWMGDVFQLKEHEKERLKKLYHSTAIGYRHSVIEDYAREKKDFEFYPRTDDLNPFPSVTQRMELYKKHAPQLALQAVQNCIKDDPAFSPGEITHVITASSTGFYAPGLDIELVEALELNPNVQRTAVNYMGCCAAFNALKVADAFCKSNPDAKVLIVCLEMCTIHFQRSKDWKEMVANSLFADGAAALLVQAEPAQNSFELKNFYSKIDVNGKKDVAWLIGDHGFNVTLSAYVPRLVEGGIKQLTDELLKDMDVAIQEIDYFAIHPGGRRIIEACEEALNISREDARFAYDVLKNYGNMSSPSTLFVLKKIKEQLSEKDKGKHVFSVAFGPGLALESMLLKVN